MSEPLGPPRLRVAVTGTSSFIGAAVSKALSAEADVAILTRSMARAMRGGEGGVELRPCDHFSRGELEEALHGVDVAVYLVHNRDPSARLDQAQSRDMDLLVADNFAWAAARAGVRQIICRAPLLASTQRRTARDAWEMEEVLKSHGVPVTVLRTGLVLGPGGELSKLLASMVGRLPVIPIPQEAEAQLWPIHLEGFLAAVQHCVGHPETLGEAYDLCGPESVTLHGLLQETATLLGRRVRFLSWPGMPRGLFGAMLRVSRPSLQADFLTYLMDMFSGDAPGQDNPVMREVAQRWQPLRNTLEASVLAARGGALAPPAQRAMDDEVIRQTRRVRSIQRLRLPERRNAEWLADHYFKWLGSLLHPFVRTTRDENGSWTVRQWPGNLTMLQLTFVPERSSADRRMYFITGGLLARFLGGRKARFEIRDFLKGRFSMVAIHDFDPSLPWLFYRFTQAVIHGLVMKGFQGHMEQLADGEPML